MMTKSTSVNWIAVMGIMMSSGAFAGELKLDCENGYYDGTPAITADILDGSITNVEVTYLFEAGPTLPIKIASIIPEPSGRLTYLLTYTLENDSTAHETFLLPEDLSTFAVGTKFKSAYRDVVTLSGSKTTTNRTLDCTVTSK